MSPKRHCRTEPDAMPAMTGGSEEEQDGSEAEAVDLGEESETDSLFRSSPDEMPTAPARDTLLRPAAKARTGRREEGGLPTTPAPNSSIAWNGVPPYISPAGPPPPSRSGTDFPLPGTRPMHEAAPPVYTPGGKAATLELDAQPRAGSGHSRCSTPHLVLPAATGARPQLRGAGWTSSTRPRLPDPHAYWPTSSSGGIQHA